MLIRRSTAYIRAFPRCLSGELFGRPLPHLAPYGDTRREIVSEKHKLAFVRKARSSVNAKWISSSLGLRHDVQLLPPALPVGQRRDMHRGEMTFEYQVRRKKRKHMYAFIIICPTYGNKVLH